jgi:S1-C subfamily serine protease
VPKFRHLIVAVVAAAAVFSGSANAATHSSTPSPKSSPTKGVVIVTTNLAYEDASAAGTGIVLTSNGEVLTKNHVIRGATTINVIVPASGRKYSASVIGYDISDDVALLKLSGAAGLATATRGNSATLRIGSPTTAVGNANGGGKLVITKGKVVALNRSITVNDDQGGTAQLTNLIQTSALLVPGDSGGPLLDATGRVVGIDAAGSAQNAFSDATGQGYAIPFNKAISLVKQIEAGQASALVHIGKTAFIGMSVGEANAGGLTVQSVVSGMPAAQAGLDQGYVIVSIDGKTLSTVAQLRNALFAHHPGDTVALAYVDPLGNQGTAQIVLADGPPQ